MLVPIVDIELAQPLGMLDALDGTQPLRVVGRLHGVPVADMMLPAGATRGDEAELRRALLPIALDMVRRELLRHSLLAGTTIGPTFVAGSPDLAGAGRLSDLTIAICTRDRAPSLVRLLETIARRNQPSQVLIVDNAPADETTAQAAARFPRVRYVREPRPGLDHARNAAVAAAETPCICFVDDDAEPEVHWTPRIAAAFGQSPELDAVTGFVLPRSLETQAQLDFEAWGGFGRRLARRWFVSPGDGTDVVLDHVPNPAAIGVGVNMSFRVATLRRAGGFDALLDVGAPGKAGGDIEVFLRLLGRGAAILYDPGIVVRHEHRRDAPDIRAQVESWSHGYVAALLRFAAMFPRERAAVARLIALGLIPWNIRRAVTARGRGSFPRSLAWSEARGQLRALTSVGSWFRSATAYPLATPEGAHARLVHVVHVEEPLRPIPEGERARVLDIEVRCAGRTVARPMIRNGGRYMSAARLADGLSAAIPASAFGGAFQDLARRVILGS